MDIVLLFVYVLIALGFSFLCSIAEAVMLSVSTAHISLLEEAGGGAGPVLRSLKDDIGKPLAAILTLNTIAHTMGAAGAGSQAAVVFGSTWVGVASAVLTLLILVFSEIIPKTLGAHYWRQLAPVTAYGLKYLVIILHPFVVLSERITRNMTDGPTLNGFSRQEFAAMADIGAEEGALAVHESEIMKNLLRFNETRISDAMTPRAVIFAVPETLRVEEYFYKFDAKTFSRIPLYRDEISEISGFVLRSDLLLAQARGNTQTLISNYRRDMPVMLASMTLAQAFDEFLRSRAHICLVVDEYGGVKGIITLEDVLETLLGLEIIDESDRTTDMQAMARKLWQRRARAAGVDTDEATN